MRMLLLQFQDPVLHSMPLSKVEVVVLVVVLIKELDLYPNQGDLSQDLPGPILPDP